VPDIVLPAGQVKQLVAVPEQVAQVTSQLIQDTATGLSYRVPSLQGHVVPDIVLPAGQVKQLVAVPEQVAQVTSQLIQDTATGLSIECRHCKDM
jgi:hypothetical protein